MSRVVDSVIKWPPSAFGQADADPDGRGRKGAPRRLWALARFVTEVRQRNPFNPVQLLSNRLQHSPSTENLKYYEIRLEFLMCSLWGLFVDDKKFIPNQPLWGVLAHNLALTQMQWELGILDVSTHCCIPLIRKSREGKLKKERKVKLAQTSYHHSAAPNVHAYFRCSTYFFTQMSSRHSVGLGQQWGNGNWRFCSITHPYWGFLILPWHLKRDI